jgi:hypothetical protein
VIGDYIPLSEYEAVLAENRALKRELEQARAALYDQSARSELQSVRMKHILNEINERRAREASEEPGV